MILKSVGLGACAAGVLLMIAGDDSTIRLARFHIPPSVLDRPPIYLVLLLAGTVCFVAGSGGPFSRIRGAARVAKAVGLLLLALILSTLVSDEPGLSAESLLAALCIVVSGWMFALLLTDDRFHAAIGPILGIALLVLGWRVIVWRYSEGWTSEAYHVRNNAWLGKIQLSWVFGVLAPLLLAWSMSARRQIVAVFYGATWLVIAAAMYVLQARMGIIVMGITAVGVLASTVSHWRRALAIVGIAAVVGVAVVERTRPLARYVASTIANPELNPGVGMRLGIWRDALRLFRARPVAGHGLGTFDVAAYASPDSVADPAFRRAGWHAHNVYLHLLAETGVIGLAAWCAFWLALLAKLSTAWRRSDPSERPPIAGAFWGISAFLLLSMTEVMIAARVHESFRMNLTVALLVALAVSEVHWSELKTTAASSGS